ncbi:MAG: tetratricopeptide repeat protein [PVC group bacterium]|nr:tetratricopeptide repeat protein [PVC group bacterium]
MVRTRKFLFIISLFIILILKCNMFLYAAENEDTQQFIQYLKQEIATLTEDNTVLREILISDAQQSESSPHKSFIARLVAEVELLRQKTSRLQEKEQEVLELADLETADKITKLQKDRAALSKKNIILKEELIGLREKYQQVSQAAEFLGEDNTRLNKLTDSQWIVIAEREKMFADLRQEIADLKQTIEQLKQRHEKEKNSMSIEHEEAIANLENEVVFLKEEKHLLNDSYSLLEKRYNFTEEQLKLWDDRAAELFGRRKASSTFRKVKQLPSFSEKVESGDPSIEKARLGLMYTKQRRYRDAITAYEQAIARNSQIAAYYYQLGLLYAHIKNNAKAVNAFETYLRLNPNSSNKGRVNSYLRMLR